MIGSSSRSRRQETPLGDDELETVRRQVARVISLDHDGEAFHQLCAGRPGAVGGPRRRAGVPAGQLLLAVRGGRLVDHQCPPGPAAGHHRAEAAVGGSTASASSWPGSGRSRCRLRAGCWPSRPFPACRLTGSRDCMPSPRPPSRASCRRIGSGPCRRSEAKTELQELPGIGPFYSALIVVRSLGHADVLSIEESRSREAIQRLYGVDHELSDAELTADRRRLAALPHLGDRYDQSALFPLEPAWASAGKMNACQRVTRYGGPASASTRCWPGGS